MAIEQTELTRGRKIDMGDRILQNIDADRSLEAAMHVEMAHNLRNVFADIARELVELGSFPFQETVRHNDLTTKDKYPFLVIEKVRHEDRDVLLLNPTGHLMWGTNSVFTISEGGGKEVYINRASLTDAEPYFYVVSSGAVFDALEGAVRSAQEEWYGRPMPDREEID